jgi:hypothetical protein
MEAMEAAIYVEYDSIECLLSYMNEGIPRSLYAPRSLAQGTLKYGIPYIN